MNKKAQLKMVENIGVLVIFLVLIVIVIIFFMAFQSGSIEEQVSEFKTRNAVQLATKIALLPEFQCRRNNVLEDHCIDILRMNSARLIMSDTANEDYYFRILGYSTIKTQSIYPEMFGVTLYNKVKPLFSNNDTFSIPISIYDPINKIYNYGILEVNVYG
ncbi:hypothetical protein J4418_03545 [Candidatus Woesearchaeota archaeon]|nr:hypothetical protein [Candidatus Woesearchaeota archaeon]